MDPAGATAALAGQPDEHFAWWAWACHDPELALQTAIESNPARIGNVAWGIGEFHPQWLRENFERIPESGRGLALQGLVKWGEVDDAMATLEFLREQNCTPPRDLLRNVVRQDPWEAYAWFEENGPTLNSSYGSQDSAMSMLINELADSHPDVLDQLIAQQPSGERKRSMEHAAFRNLLKLDPEAALEKARQIEAPRVGSERIAEVGLQLARTDPDRGFEIARDLFERFPQALSTGTVVSLPNGRERSSGGGNPVPQKLLSILATQDPQRAMEMFSPKPEETLAPAGAESGAMIGAGVGPSSGQGPEKVIASTWAANDLEGFGDWVIARNDQGTTDRLVPRITSQLRNQQRFGEAADWAMKTSPDSGRLLHLHSLLSFWKNVEPDHARQWVESAHLTGDESARLQSILNRNQ